jgi:hypothetical protein
MLLRVIIPNSVTRGNLLNTCISLHPSQPVRMFLIKSFILSCIPFSRAADILRVCTRIRESSDKRIRSNDAIKRSSSCQCLSLLCSRSHLPSQAGQCPLTWLHLRQSVAIFEGLSHFIHISGMFIRYGIFG